MCIQSNGLSWPKQCQNLGHELRVQSLKIYTNLLQIRENFEGGFIDTPKNKLQGSSATGPNDV